MQIPAHSDDIQRADRSDLATQLARGVCRMLADLKIASLTEFSLRNGRRADIIGLAPDGIVTITEIKSSVADFRSDRKWGDYLDYCDRYFFAVPQGFPYDILPGDCGLIIADAYDAAVVRESGFSKLPPARRRSIHLQFARTAGERLRLLTDPV